MTISIWGIKVVSKGCTSKMQADEPQSTARDLSMDVRMMELVNLGLGGVTDGCLIEVCPLTVLDQNFGSSGRLSVVRQCEFDFVSSVDISGQKVR